MKLAMDLPIIQAPMAGGATTSALVAAVSNAGALGSLAGGYLSPDEIRKEIREIKKLTTKPFAVNLFVPQPYQDDQEKMQLAIQAITESSSELEISIQAVTPPYLPSFAEQVQVLLDEKVTIFSFTFGIPEGKWLQEFRKRSVTLIGTATSLAEGKALEDAGVDFIVAQASEAGGHRGTFIGREEESLIPLTTLVPLLVKHLKTPIIAAGGIMNGEDILAQLANGAVAVQMGSAFLNCPESGIHPAYRASLNAQTRDMTALTRAFSGKLARGINNYFMMRMSEHENEILDYPVQNKLTLAMRREAARQNNAEFMSLWAGQRAFLCSDLPVQELIRRWSENL